MKNKSLINQRFFNLILFFGVFSFLFLWDIKFNKFFEFRYLIILIFFASFLNDFKNALKLSFIYVIFFIVISLHQLINIFYESFSSIFNFIKFENSFIIDTYPESYLPKYKDKIGYTAYNLISSFAAFVLFYISMRYSKKIEKFFYSFSVLFLFLNYITLIISNFFLDATVGDGFFLEANEVFCRYAFELKSHFYLFPENSHLGMVLPSVILIFLYYFSKQSNIKNLLLLLSSLLLGFLFYSATLLVGVMISIIFIIIAIIRSKKYYFIFLSLLLFIITFVLLKNNPNCSNRIFFISQDRDFILTEDNLSAAQFPTRAYDGSTFGNKKNILLFADESTKNIFLLKNNDITKNQNFELSLIEKSVSNNDQFFKTINSKNQTQSQQQNDIYVDVHNNLILKRNSSDEVIKNIYINHTLLSEINNLLKNTIDSSDDSTIDSSDDSTIDSSDDSISKNISVANSNKDDVILSNPNANDSSDDSIRKNISVANSNKDDVILSNPNANYDQIDSISNLINQYNNKVRKFRRYINTNSTNLTTSLHLNSINLGIITLLDRPFGWGINRFEYAFKYYMPNVSVQYHEIRVFNYNDGASNLAKLVVEFGIFSVLLFIFFIYWGLSNRVSVITKIFFIPFVATQLIRGAGYFNGGFLLIVLLMISTMIYSNYSKSTSKNLNV